MHLNWWEWKCWETLKKADSMTTQLFVQRFFLVWSRDSQIVKLSDYFVKHSQSIDIDHQPEFVMRVLAKKKVEMSVWHIYYGAMSLFSVSISSPLIFMHVSFVAEFSQVWTMELCLRNCVFCIWWVSSQCWTVSII